MVEKYLKYSKEVEKLMHPFFVNIDDKRCYYVRNNFWWIGDAPAHHALAGWAVITSTFGILPQIELFNIARNGTRISFVTKDNWAVLVWINTVFTPSEYKNAKQSGTLPSTGYAVILDNELNDVHSDKVDAYIARNFPDLINDRAGSYDARFDYSKILRQPQLYKSIPHSIHPILAILHMIKTVLSRFCSADLNYYLLKTGDSDLNKDLIVVQQMDGNVLLLFEDNFEECAGYSIFKQFKTWIKINSQSSKKKDARLQLKEAPKKFKFGNLNKRLSFLLFVNTFHFIITMDNFYQSEKIHFYSAWTLCVRLRVARCVVIYMQTSFKDCKHLIAECTKLNRIILRLVFNFFPTSVICFVYLFFVWFWIPTYISCFIFLFFKRCITICCCSRLAHIF